MVSQSTTRKVQCNSTVVTYSLTRKNVKNINLRINAEGEVLISANSDVTDQEIDSFVVLKAKYINKTLKQFEQLQQIEKGESQYVSGESFPLLGRMLRLKVSEGQDESVISDGLYLVLTVKNKQDHLKKCLLINRYYLDQCDEIFTQILKTQYPIVKKYGISFPQLKMRNMKTRWGSCSPSHNSISLNIKLIELPKNCIEYVVLHELCHFIHANHSKEFYNFMTALMPDWKERKALLEKQGNYYH